MLYGLTSIYNLYIYLIYYDLVFLIIIDIMQLFLLYSSNININNVDYVVNQIEQFGNPLENNYCYVSNRFKTLPNI